MDDKRDRIRVSQLFIIYNGSIEHLGNISKRAWGGGYFHSSKPFGKTTEEVTDVASTGRDFIDERRSWLRE